MRIAIFTETFLPKWDGIANTLCYLLEHLRHRNHECVVFAPQGAPESYAGSRIVGLPSFSCPFYRDLKLVPPLVDVAKELEAFKPDLVHLVNLASLGLIGLRQARVMHLPTVASYHTDLPGYARHYGMPFLEDSIWAYFRRIHNQADLNLCPSHYTKTQLEEHGFERVEVWGRGVDAKHFNPIHANEEWRNRLTSGKPDRYLMLYAGRLASEKRIDWLRPLLDLLPDTALAIIGDGPLRDALEVTFRGTHTVFTGYLKGAVLAQAYASSDLFVFPSASETFGNVVIEAMASGLPVIAAGVGGPVDHIFSGRNGYLSDPENSIDFAAKVWRCLTDIDALHKMGLAARAYAETQSWGNILDGLMNQYARAIQHGAMRHTPPGLGARWIHRHKHTPLTEFFGSRLL